MSSAKPYSLHKFYHLKNAISLPSNTISEFYFKKFGYFGYQDLLRDLARNVRSLTIETSRDNEVIIVIVIINLVCFPSSAKLLF